MNNKNELYIINTITPLHVGSGASNVGIVDNLVQRDAITNYPIINGSSIKGAVREYFNWIIKNEENHKNKGEKFINYIFGQAAEVSENGGESYGHYKFFQSNLIAFPVRCTVKAYMMAICEESITEVINNAEIFDIDNKLIKELKELVKVLKASKINEGEAQLLSSELSNDEAYAEDLLIKNDFYKKNKMNLETIKEYLGKDLVLLSNKEFKDLLEDLPVIARNKLSNGKSDNLWYEEVVPREAKFFTLVVKEDTTEERMAEFDEIFTAKPIQIGANGSIGYGFCKISKVGDN